MSPRALGESSVRKLATRVGKNLRELRLLAGFTLEQLGRRARLSKAYLSSIENGHRIPEIRALLGLADAMEIDVRELVS